MRTEKQKSNLLIFTTCQQIYLILTLKKKKRRKQMSLHMLKMATYFLQYIIIVLKILTIDGILTISMHIFLTAKL